MLRRPLRRLGIAIEKRLLVNHALLNVCGIYYRITSQLRPCDRSCDVFHQRFSKPVAVVGDAMFEGSMGALFDGITIMTKI
jgi:hypothetical protein